MAYKEHEQRVVDEFTELCDKLDKLIAFLVKGKPTFIDDVQWKLLQEQHTAMEQYMEILNTRITYFKDIK